MLGMLTAILALASCVDFLSHQTMQHTLCFPRPSFSRFKVRRAYGRGYSVGVLRRFWEVPNPEMEFRPL